jgi:hypothetical protein
VDGLAAESPLSTIEPAAGNLARRMEQIEMKRAYGLALENPARRSFGLALRALVGAAIVFGVVAGNATAASPSATIEDGLSAADQAMARQKLALANKEIASPGSVSGGAAASVLCPFGTSPLVSLSTTTAGSGGRIQVTPSSFCAGYYGSISARPVEQETSYWCGVAAVQVVSDYAWGYQGATHKWSQTYISNTWTHTTSAGTSTTAEINGLNGAVGAKLPNGFKYMGVWHVVNGKNTLTGPLTGSEWHGYLRTDLSATYKMPMVVSVSPMDPNLPFGRATWVATRAPKQNAGHWIVLVSWDGVWDGTTGPQVGYDDSGVKGTGGVTGRDPASNVYAMIKQYNPNHGTNGVVW